jgi:hypothetical protein
MPIKFTCPHCKRGMIVEDRMAGMKGKCKACQKIITVPTPKKAAAQPPKPSPPATPAAPPSDGPARPPADVEAEAAALFADEPPPAEPVETKTIDLNCPFCDEPIHFPANLAGKREPCPECKRIIKVPELVKKDPKDWRKVDPRGPSGARLPDQPAPEGAWSSTAASTVGRQALVEAGVIPQTKPPRTLWQKTRLPLAAVTGVVLLSVGGWLGYRLWSQRAIERALQEALAFPASDQGNADAKALHQAAIALGAGEFYLEKKIPDCVKDAKNQFGSALTTLRPAPESTERDALLADLALAEVEMGGEGVEVNKGMRQPWLETQKLLQATLREIHNDDAKREAVRAVSQRLIARRQTALVLPLVSQIYSAPDAEKAAALSVIALELLRANDQPTAEKAADDALKLYEAQKPPPVRAEVVAVAMTLGKKVPAPGKEAKDEEKANEHVGQVEGLARKGEWDRARQKAEEKDFDDAVQFRAFLTLAEAAVDAKADIADKAIELAKAKSSEKEELAWPLFHLTQLAIRAGLPDDRLQALTSIIPNRSLRGRAQLAIFRARLEQTQQPVEDAAADKIEPRSLARVLASQALARHNTRLNADWAKTVQGWEQPQKAFGSLGVALGLQDRKR